MFNKNDTCETLAQEINCDSKKDIKIEWPTGDGVLHIYDDYQPLFTSATWSVTAKLNGKMIINTVPSQKPHDERFIKKWAQYVIRNRKQWLRDVGVDVFSEYIKWGGNVEDLNESLFIMVGGRPERLPYHVRIFSCECVF